MEARFARLEDDVREVKADLKLLLAKVSALPTRANLNSYMLAGLTLGFATMAIVIGGIIGGLSWIRPEPPAVVSAPQPIIITLPPAAAPAVPEQPKQ
jgi:hypothetical protein